MTRDPRIQAVIEEIVRRLVAGYAPQKIILFGSHAHGEPDEDSDIDLLIVKETSDRFLDRLTKVRELAWGAHPHIPFGPIVLTPQEIEGRLKIGDQFIAQILRKGKVLYASSELALHRAVAGDRE